MYLVAWKVHLEPCWSKSAQKRGMGRYMTNTLR